EDRHSVRGLLHRVPGLLPRTWSAAAADVFMDAAALAREHELFVLPGARPGTEGRLPGVDESHAAHRCRTHDVLAAAAADAGADAACLGAVLPVDRTPVLAGAAPQAQRQQIASGRVGVRIGVVTQI